MHGSRRGNRGFGPTWTGGSDPPIKSQFIWVSIENKQLDPPPPPPEKQKQNNNNKKPLEQVGPPQPWRLKIFRCFFCQMDLGKQLRESRGLNFGLSLHLYFMYASREGSGKSVHVSRLAGIAHRCNKYQSIVKWPIYK